MIMTKRSDTRATSSEPWCGWMGVMVIGGGVSLGVLGCTTRDEAAAPPRDAGLADVGPTDATLPDATPPDGDASDAASSDAAQDADVDASPIIDAGPADAGTLATVCALPPTYGELRSQPWLVDLGLVVVDDAFTAPPGSVREAQLIAAVGATGVRVTSAAEAIRATDDDAFDVLTLLDVGTRRTFEVVTATYGDSRYGRVFETDTVLAVATITDSDLGACTVERGLEGTPCTEMAACAPGICLGVVREERCVEGVCTPTDVVLGEGRCVRTRVPDPRPSRGAPCTADTMCPRVEGLTCSLLGDGPDAPGFCEDAWLRRRFAFDGAAIEGATTTIPLVVSGVASVSLRTTLSAVISHPRPADLTVSLQHPGGASRAVVFADPGATGAEVVLRDVRALLPSDEAINGTWSLVIEDAGGGVSPPESAFVFGLSLEVLSWFD
jgi:hypothetical protein